MVRLARNAILKTDPTTQTLDEMAVTLAAEFTLVRSQAIEMCAGVADAVGDDPSRSSHAQDAGDEIAASIRSLR